MIALNIRTKAALPTRGRVGPSFLLALQCAAALLPFGAVADGKTDDTTAIQAVIDAKAGSIRFPAGKYRIISR